TSFSRCPQSECACVIINYNPRAMQSKCEPIWKDKRQRWSTCPIQVKHSTVSSYVFVLLHIDADVSSTHRNLYAIDYCKTHGNVLRLTFKVVWDNLDGDTKQVRNITPW